MVVCSGRLRMKVTHSTVFHDDESNAAPVAANPAAASRMRAASAEASGGADAGRPGL